MPKLDAAPVAAQTVPAGRLLAETEPRSTQSQWPCDHPGTAPEGRACTCFCQACHVTLKGREKCVCKGCLCGDSH